MASPEDWAKLAAPDMDTTATSASANRIVLLILPLLKIFPGQSARVESAACGFLQEVVEALLLLELPVHTQCDVIRFEGSGCGFAGRRNVHAGLVRRCAACGHRRWSCGGRQRAGNRAVLRA